MNFKRLLLLLGLGSLAATGVVIVYIRRDSDIEKQKNSEQEKK